MHSEDPKLQLNALADAISVVLHGDWLVFGRPTGENFNKYHTLVRQAMMRLKCVRSVARAQVERPRISEAQERQMLGAKEDGDLNVFEGLFYEAVMGA